MSKTKVSVVSYLNSKVFIKGLLSSTQNRFDVSLDIPSVCAQKLITNEVEIGLVPVAIIPELKNSYIISDYCISANGIVNSVFLFSNTELKKINKIYLDTHSRSSNLLCKILVNEFWKIEVEFVEKAIEYAELKEGEAFVLIGDRTFDKIGNFITQLDLAEHWKAFTNLPFVFAAWVANTKISDEIVADFNAYLKIGFDAIEEVIAENTLSNFDVNDYLKNKIEYVLNDEKRKAIDLYLEKSLSYR